MKTTTGEMVAEAKTVGAAVAHANANWEEAQHIAALFFRGRERWRSGFAAARAEYDAAYAALFDAYYARGA